MRLFLTKPKSLLGIAFNDRKVSLVELAFKKKKYHLLTYGIIELAEGEVIDNQIIDSERMGHQIAKLVAQLNCKTQQAATALSDNLVITREIDMPAELIELDIDAQIRVDADQYIPYPLSEVSLDFEVLGQSDLGFDFNKILLVVSRTEYLDQYCDALVFGGLKPNIIDIDREAKQRVLQFILQNGNSNSNDSIVTDSTNITVLVDIGHNRSTVYIAHHGQFEYQVEQLFGSSHLTRSIASHYDLSADAAEQASLNLQSLSNKNELDWEETIWQPFIDTLIEYIKVAFEQYALTDPDCEIEHILLSGEGSQLPNLDSSLQRQMNLPVYLVNPFSSMVIDSSIDTQNLLKQASQLMTACGLAMRCQMSKPY
ncbi:type IV pilus assembly protein PilM [Psychrobacter sp.]|uniref:type IV pilus assembly protein PilM n=1 Tax=Psychrobacter sp. TaxID=56811 RepID=UPI0025FAA728|nr:type IV pilus assembly protein PilM [Psychrobacter sp.]